MRYIKTHKKIGRNGIDVVENADLKFMYVLKKMRIRWKKFIDAILLSLRIQNFV